MTDPQRVAQRLSGRIPMDEMFGSKGHEVVQFTCPYCGTSQVHVNELPPFPTRCFHCLNAYTVYDPEQDS